MHSAWSLRNPVPAPRFLGSELYMCAAIAAFYLRCDIAWVSHDPKQVCSDIGKTVLRKSHCAHGKPSALRLCRCRHLANGRAVTAEFTFRSNSLSSEASRMICVLSVLVTSQGGIRCDFTIDAQDSNVGIMKFYRKTSLLMGIL